MTPREPTVFTDGGPWATHDQRCAVLKGEPAVIDIGTGVFHPSWKAQSMGYRLVKADTLIRRVIVRWMEV